MHREEMISRIVNAYLGGVTGAREAYESDAAYHERLYFMIRLLEIFDLAMEQEQMLPGARFAVLERVMMAAPDPEETRQRLQVAQKLLARWPSNWKLSKED